MSRTIQQVEAAIVAREPVTEYEVMSAIRVSRWQRDCLAIVPAPPKPRHDDGYAGTCMGVDVYVQHDAPGITFFTAEDLDVLASDGARP